MRGTAFEAIAALQEDLVSRGVVVSAISVKWDDEMRFWRYQIELVDHEGVQRGAVFDGEVFPSLPPP